MCGRYAITTSPAAMRALLDYPEQPNFPPRYNIAPTQPVPVVRIERGARQFALMRWGFIPGFVKDLKTFPLVFNIRSEGMMEKTSFRAAFQRRRCLMPADGFYEWQPAGEGRGAVKQPWLIRRPDRALFSFAAVWHTWHAPDGSEIDTVALLTGPANATLAPVHHRCPIIVAPQDHESWLGGEESIDEATRLLRPPPDNLLERVAVGTAVNKVANDGPELQEPAIVTQPPPAMRRRRGAPDDGQASLF